MIPQALLGLGGGLRMPRPELDALASSMKSSAVQRRRKDPLRRQRRVKRKKLRRQHKIKMAVLAGLRAAVLGVAGVIVYRMLAGGGGPSDFPPEAYQDSGRFICENCGNEWQGEVKLAHPYDPFVDCRQCGLRQARKATQCPQCGAWSLEEIPPSSIPFAKMSNYEKRRWDLERHKLMAAARCPDCGALLHPYRPPTEPDVAPEP